MPPNRSGRPPRPLTLQNPPEWQGESGNPYHALTPSTQRPARQSLGMQVIAVRPITPATVRPPVSLVGTARRLADQAQRVKAEEKTPEPPVPSEGEEAPEIYGRKLDL